MKMRLLFLTASLAFVCCFLGFAAIGQKQEPNDKPRSTRPEIVKARTPDWVGEEIRVVDLDGLKKFLQRDPKEAHPLLVNFWATWCDGCREEFPDLVKIDDDYRSKGLNFLSVTVDELEDKRLAVSFIQEMKAKMPVVLLNVADKEPAIHAVDANWDGALPATFVYDRTGTIVYRHFGKIKPEELRAVIDKTIKP